MIALSSARWMTDEDNGRTVKRLQTTVSITAIQMYRRQNISSARLFGRERAAPRRHRVAVPEGRRAARDHRVPRDDEPQRAPRSHDQGRHAPREGTLQTVAPPRVPSTNPPRILRGFRHRPRGPRHTQSADNGHLQTVHPPRVPPRGPLHEPTADPPRTPPQAPADPATPRAPTTALSRACTPRGSPRDPLRKPTADPPRTPADPATGLCTGPRARVPLTPYPLRETPST